MKIKTGFIIRNVGGDNVVVPTGVRCNDFKGMVRLNDSATLLWNFYQAEHTLEEGVAAFCKEYEVDDRTAAEAIRKFLDLMAGYKLLEK